MFLGAAVLISNLLLCASTMICRWWVIGRGKFEVCCVTSGQYACPKMSICTRGHSIYSVYSTQRLTISDNIHVCTYMYGLSSGCWECMGRLFKAVIYIQEAVIRKTGCDPGTSLGGSTIATELLILCRQ